MQHQPTAPAPYAIAFSIEELILVRSWATQKKLRLFVSTDQVLDGAEFEEVLVIVPQGRQHRNLTLWRTPTTVFAQLPQGRPRAFATLKDALEALRPAPDACELAAYAAASGVTRLG